MKKLLPLLLIVLTIAMSACSISTTSTSLGSTEDGVPIAVQLAAGTLKLTVTDQDVSAGTAGDISVSLVAPVSEGSYTGYWRLADEDRNVTSPNLSSYLRPMYISVFLL